jgi:hypothetical protein
MTEETLLFPVGSQVAVQPESQRLEDHSLLPRERSERHTLSQAAHLPLGQAHGA